MFCSKCGTENKQEALFCKKCGAPIKKAAPANAPATTTVTAPPITEKIKQLPKKMLLAIAAAVVLFIVVIVAVSKASHTIDLNKYTTVETEGYDGYGRASISIDWDAIEAKYGKKLSYTNEARKAYDYISIYRPIDALEDFVSLTADKRTGLVNGDEIVLTFEVSETLNKYLNCKLKYKDFSYSVDGLTKVDSFDPFENMKVSFAGTAPNGYMEYEYNGSEFATYDFTCDKNGALTNGDVVTLTLNYGYMDSFIERTGKAPSKTSQSYTVSGLPEYACGYASIQGAFTDKLKEDTYNTVLAYTAREYSKDVIVTPIQYEGYAMCSPIAGVTYYYNSNILYLIYSTYVYYKNNDPVKVYYPVRFNNIILGDEISYESNEGIMGSGYIVGYSVYSAGYTNPITLLSDLKSKYGSDYTLEYGEGFDNYANFKAVTSIDELSTEYREAHYEAALNTIQNYISRYSSGSTVEGLGLFGEYFLTSKNENASLENVNKYYVVYYATLSSSRRRFDTTTVYYPVEYTGVLKMPDNSYYTYNSNGIEGYSYLSNSWYTTDGFIDGDEMFRKLITAYCDKYTYERTGSLILFGE